MPAYVCPVCCWLGNSRQFLFPTLSCGLQPHSVLASISFSSPSLRTLVRVATLTVKIAGDQAVPSLRTLVRVATAYMHKMFGACTDLTMCALTLSSVKDAYLVVQGLVVQGLIPTISTLGREVAPYYWCEAAMQNMIALASHGSSAVRHTWLYTPGMLLPRLILGSLGGGGRFRRHLLSAALDNFRWHFSFSRTLARPATSRAAEASTHEDLRSTLSCWLQHY